MDIICDTTDFYIDSPTAVAIGKFDGLHLGHKELFKKLFEAKKQGLKTAVFTFDPSPGAFFSALSGQGEYKELMTREEKRACFEKIGVDYLVEYPFRAETAAVTPEDYVNRYLLRQMNAALIVAGEDVSFGKGGKGDAVLLKQLAADAGSGPGAENVSHAKKASESTGCRVMIIPKIRRNGVEISSTLVREMVEKGKMEDASLLLGEEYMISGEVMHGNHIGRTLSMPTANLYPASDKLLPPRGVYFSYVVMSTDGGASAPVHLQNDATGSVSSDHGTSDKEGSRAYKIYPAITNIGIRPTVRGGPGVNRGLSVETHILDFDEDIYGMHIEVRLLHFSRPERQFAGFDRLMAQMRADVSARRSYERTEGITD